MGRLPWTLVGTVGLPYSGKSTWARAQAEAFGIPIVCPDEIRVALHGERYLPRAEPFVWAIAKVMVRALFSAGHPEVILDATNTTPERRAEWATGEWELRWKVIDTPMYVCLRRAELERDEVILDVIERMAEQWDPPTTDLWPEPSDA